MTEQQVMIVGVGNVGGHVLDMLSRRHNSPRLTLVGRNEDYLKRRANLATLVANQLGFDPCVDWRVADVTNLDQTASVVSAVRPDIVFSTVSLQPWWVIGELPEAIFRELDEAEIGPWLPMQLTLIYKLMQAIQHSSHNPLVVNAALPDATHAILSHVGLQPTIGIGNVANVIPALRRGAALLLECERSAIDVRMIAEAYVTHRLPRHANAGEAPFHLTILRDGVDVTNSIDVNELLRLVATRLARLGGVQGSVLTAASALTVLDALLGDSDALVHAPGPNGLIGGYPVRVRKARIELALPDGVSSEEAQSVNAGGLLYDGIAQIRDDASVVYTERNAQIMKDMLGYDCKEMQLDESADRADELAARYAEFRKKFER